MKTKTAEAFLAEKLKDEKYRGNFGLNKLPCVLYEVVEKLMEEYARPSQDRLDNGRDFLMQADPTFLTVEDCLEAFGFKRNGLGDAD